MSASTEGMVELNVMLVLIDKTNASKNRNNRGNKCQNCTEEIEDRVCHPEEEESLW